jgi:predicted AAA+ superfamily ATPase
MTINMSEKISQVIREYWDSPIPAVKNRDIHPSLEDDLINDIIGPRRSGKTYLMFLTIKRLIEKKPKESTIYLKTGGFYHQRAHTSTTSSNSSMRKRC